MIRFVILVAVALLSGCATSTFQTNENAEYRREAIVTVNGTEYRGTGVLPRTDRYELAVRFRDDADQMILRTCHREVVQQNVGASLNYEYVPSEPERATTCPLQIIGLNKGGQHSFAYFVFEEPDKILPAVLSCDGTEQKLQGVGICQAGAGLIQQVRFEGPTIFSDKGNANPNCGLSGPEPSDRFSVKIATGQCVYTFGELAKPYRRFRLHTYGYEEVVR